LELLAGDADALETKCVHPRALLPEMPAVTAMLRRWASEEWGAGEFAGVFAGFAGEGVLPGSGSW